jgi:hypothetical protein
MTFGSAKNDRLFSRVSIVSLDEAIALTGLDLVSAKSTESGDGSTYQQMEELSESKSHQSARVHGMAYFSSIGYRILPEGIGVKGTRTFADFLAMRDGRAVFVEVLSDGNVKDETLKRKAQLQNYGELCFILFTGTKRSKETDLIAAKTAISSWADVLYFRLDGYGGNLIEETHSATIAYDTTRSRGIRVAASFDRAGTSLRISVRFITHLYQCGLDGFFYHPVPLRHHYEEIFLRIFARVAYATGYSIKYSSSRPDLTAFRAMRRNSGLRMIDAAGRVGARLKSEYRGAPVSSSHVWADLIHSDFSPDDIFGVFALEKAASGDGPRALLAAMEVCGLKPEFDQEAFEKVLNTPRRSPGHRHGA